MDSLEKQKEDLMMQLNKQSSKEDGDNKTQEDKDRSKELEQSDSEDVTGLTDKVDELRSEVIRLKRQLKSCQLERNLVLKSSVQF